MRGRWCEKHQRRECGEARNYPATGPCHGLPLKGKDTCTHHDRARKPVGRREAARKLVQLAIKDGTLGRPELCELCGRDWLPLDGHHEDYARPLDVIWLCGSCHLAVALALDALAAGIDEDTS